MKPIGVCPIDGGPSVKVVSSKFPSSEYSRIASVALLLGALFSDTNKRSFAVSMANPNGCDKPVARF